MPGDFGNAPIRLASGASAPAASDSPEGTKLQPHPNDAFGCEFTCVDYSGTKRWVRFLNIVGWDPTSARTSTLSNACLVVQPYASRKILLRGREGHTNDLLGGGGNYFTITVEADGTTHDTFTNSGDDANKWIRHNATVEAVIDMSGLDDEADNVGSEYLRQALTETGTSQTWSRIYWDVWEIYE